VTQAFKLMLRNPNLRAILVNIFGGIMKCDVIARGVIAAAREVELSVPLVVRMKGTEREPGPHDPCAIGPADHHGRRHGGCRPT
jgi:succinyl-CoA synthetase beta subunit